MAILVKLEGLAMLGPTHHTRTICRVASSWPSAARHGLGGLPAFPAHLCEGPQSWLGCHFSMSLSPVRLLWKPEKTA